MKKKAIPSPSVFANCKEEGLLRDSVTEKNEMGETRIMVAAADDWKPAHIKLLAAAGAYVNEQMETYGI